MNRFLKIYLYLYNWHGYDCMHGRNFGILYGGGGLYFMSIYRILKDIWRLNILSQWKLESIT